MILATGGLLGGGLTLLPDGRAVDAVEHREVGVLGENDPPESVLRWGLPLGDSPVSGRQVAGCDPDIDGDGGPFASGPRPAPWIGLCRAWSTRLSTLAASEWPWAGVRPLLVVPGRGRSVSQLFVSDDACLKCTLCVTACPVYRAEPLFPGPKVLGPEWHRAHLADPALAAAAHVDDCTFCQLCEAACPADVPVAHLIARHKAARPAGLLRTMRDGVLARPHLVGRLPALARLAAPSGRSSACPGRLGGRAPRRLAILQSRGGVARGGWWRYTWTALRGPMTAGRPTPLSGC